MVVRKRCLWPDCRRKTLDSYCGEHAGYNTPEWRAVSAFVIARDGGICQRCFEPGADTAGHKLARAFGGTDDPANLQAEHRACNSAARAL